jgi:abequosyltransferase
MDCKLLSICIPTYNRKGMLAENLNKIAIQLTPDLTPLVEICVSNNASTDDTIEYLEDFSKNNTHLDFSYTTNQTNLGPDRNIVLAMRMGKGDYIWIIGDDDVLVDGAIEKVISTIKSNINFNLLLFNRIDCSYELVPKEKRYWLSEDMQSQLFDFSDKYQEGFYYSKANDTGAIFTYISAFVAKREILTLFSYDETYYGTYYSFLFYVFSYLKWGAKVYYLNDHLVYCRLDNSSVKSAIPKRLKIDFDAFTKIRRDFFPLDDINASGFLYIIRKTHPFYKILALYSTATQKEWESYFVPHLMGFGWSAKELNAIEKLGSSFNLYQSKFKQRLKTTIKRFTK